MASVASTAIADLTFNPDVEVEEVEGVPVPTTSSYGTLYITFRDGRRYVIENFPAIEYARWIASPSIGGYFNAFVRGNY